MTLPENLIRYEDVKNETAEEYFKGNSLSINSFRNKYLNVKDPDEKTPADVFHRVAKAVSSVEETEELREFWYRKWFNEMYTSVWLPGGSVISGAGVDAKISMLNCITLGFTNDSLEAIYETEYGVAKSAARRQGLGVHFDLRPEGMRINNSSRISSGNLHWMKKFNSVGHYIGQKGRLPAFLMSISDHNPDMVKFITLKSNQTEIDHANISIHFTNAFMQAVEDNKIWKMKYTSDLGEVLETEKPASEIFDIFAVNNWAYAEPGVQLIDNIRKWSNSDYLDDKRWCVKSSNACVPDSATLLTPFGVKLFKDIQVGDFVWTGKRFALVKRKIDNGVKEVFRYSTKTTTLSATADHLVSNNQGKEFIEVGKSKHLDVQLELTSFISITDTEDFQNLQSEEIIKKESLGKMRVGDIEVDAPEHTFWCDNVIVHNCSEKFLEFTTIHDAVGSCALASANFIQLSSSIEDACEYLNGNKGDLAYSMSRFMDNVLTLEVKEERFALLGQKHSIEMLRRLGLGFTNIDGYLIYNGIGYDTDAGIETIVKLADAFNLGCYKANIALGKERGSFGAFKKEAWTKAPFVKQMIDRYDLDFTHARFVECTTIAPTGTISLMMNTRFSPLISTGIEPVVGYYWWKKERTSGSYEWSFNIPFFVRERLLASGIDLADHGMPSDSITDNDGKIGQKIVGIIEKNFPKDTFKPAHEIDPYQKMELLSRLYKTSVDAAISVTFNLPESTTKDDIKKLYMTAWKKEVKAVSIYRDRSREGVLEFEPPPLVEKRFKSKHDTLATSVIAQPKVIKRPEELPANIHHIKVHGEEWIAFVGLLDDHPYEIFAGKQDGLCLPPKYTNGVICKKKRKYYLHAGSGDEALKVSIIDHFQNDEQTALTRQLSLNLRHGTPLIYIIDQLDKSHGSIVDFAKVIMRVLKNYIREEDYKGKIKCKECGSNNLIFQEKCFRCLDCGNSKCG